MPTNPAPAPERTIYTLGDTLTTDDVLNAALRNGCNAVLDTRVLIADEEASELRSRCADSGIRYMWAACCEVAIASDDGGERAYRCWYPRDLAKVVDFARNATPLVVFGHHPATSESRRMAERLSHPAGATVVGLTPRVADDRGPARHPEHRAQVGE